MRACIVAGKILVCTPVLSYVQAADQANKLAGKGN